MAFMRCHYQSASVMRFTCLVKTLIQGSIERCFTCTNAYNFGSVHVNIGLYVKNLCSSAHFEEKLGIVHEGLFF